MNTSTNANSKDPRPAKEMQNRQSNTWKGFATALAAVTLSFLAAASLFWLASTVGASSRNDASDLEKPFDQGNAGIQSFNVSMNSKIPVQEGTNALVDIKSAPCNTRDCRITIILDSGSIVFSSKEITPGQALEVATLSEPLADGTYGATALFEVYDSVEGVKTDQKATRVRLYAQ